MVLLTDHMERNTGPLVTIVIPTYNYAKYLKKAIESCTAQSYTNLEIIIIDDGSIDRTKEIVHGIDDGRVTYHYQENQGVSSARNRGLMLAKGDFITFLDADDYLSDGSIEQRLHVMLADSDIDFVITTSYSQNNDGNILFHDKNCMKDTISDRLCEALLLKQLPFATCAVLMRSSHAKKFEFPLHLTNGEDLAFFSKVFYRTKGCFLSRPTTVIWSHADSLRHNIEDLKEQRTGLVETIFDNPYFEGNLDHIRANFTADRCFELFRRFYRSGDKRLAQQYYRKAVSIQPARIFKVDYLLKYFRTFL